MLSCKNFETLLDVPLTRIGKLSFYDVKIILFPRWYVVVQFFYPQFLLLLSLSAVYVSLSPRVDAKEKVWVEPKIIFMWPDKLNTPQLVVCRHSIPKCKFEDCKYRWRVEHNVLNNENKKYLLIDSNRAVYLKAPLSRTKNLGPFACVVELNGKPLGEGISFIKFLGKFFSKMSSFNQPVYLSKDRNFNGELYRDFNRYKISEI